MTITEESSSQALQFFNDEEARTVEALAERIIPGDGEDPGAREAGVVYYIDRAVNGFSSDLQVVYRLGLRELGEHCRDRYGAPFVDLTEDRQDEVVRELLGPEVAAEPGHLQFSAQDQPAGPRLLRLLAVVREHTVEGYFCDPVYGGNRDAAGWKLVGFPGAHWGYTAEQMAPGFDGRSIPIKTLSDLRRQLKELPPNEHFTRGGTTTRRSPQEH